MLNQRIIILLDVNTIQRYFWGGEKPVKMCKRMLGKLRSIFAWTRLMRIQVISIIPSPTPKVKCKKSKYTCRYDCEVFAASNSTDRPQPHDQFIFCNRCTDPFDEPLIDRVLTEIGGNWSNNLEFLVIGIGKELTNTVLGLLQRRKRVTVLSDVVRFPGLNAEKELLKMEGKGAKIITLEKFAEERSQNGKGKNR